IDRTVNSPAPYSTRTRTSPSSSSWRDIETVRIEPGASPGRQPASASRARAAALRITALLLHGLLGGLRLSYVFVHLHLHRGLPGLVRRIPRVVPTPPSAREDHGAEADLDRRDRGEDARGHEQPLQEPE